MAIYSLGQKTTTFTSSQASWELRTAANRCRVLELGMVSYTATIQDIGLGVPAARGITPVNVLFQAEDFAEIASVTNASLSWATSPTAPTSNLYFRRWAAPATIGAGMVWTFPRGLTVPINASLELFNIVTAVANGMWCVIEE